MTSEIRANTLKNRVGLGTVSYTNTGIVVSGIVTANSFSGPLTSNGDITGTGDLTLTSTDAGSSAAPIINLFRNSASPADADYLGQIKFQGESDTSVQRNYAKITGKILDASNGTEDGILEFAHIKAGSQTITGRWRSDSLQLLNGTALTVAGSTTVTGNIIPSSDSATDIGTNSVRFANLYADTLYGDGSNLTGISGVTINTNADNRIITGSGTANTLNGEANLTFDGTNLDLGGSQKIRIGDSQEGEIYVDGNGLKIHSHNSNSQIELESDKQFYFKYVTSGGFHFIGAGQQVLSMYGGSGGGIYFRHNNSQKLKLEGGNFTYENGATVTYASHVYIPDSIIHVGDTDTKIRFSANDTIRFETGGAARLILNNDNIVQQSGTFVVKNATGDSNGLKISQESGDESRIYNHYSGS